MLDRQKIDEKINHLHSQGWHLQTILCAKHMYFFEKNNKQLVLTKSGSLREPTKTEKKQYN